jgi:hypothetical protein
MRYKVIITLWDLVLENVIKGSFIHSFIHSLYRGLRGLAEAVRVT